VAPVIIRAPYTRICLLTGYIFKKALFEIKKLVLSEFVNEPFHSNLVNGTKNGFLECDSAQPSLSSYNLVLGRTFLFRRYWD
jgi:hypothetical protein